ncbi:MAG: penicillin acylase family protein [Candidatus Neomarinimicrobiota bacterium]
MLKNWKLTSIWVIGVLIFLLVILKVYLDHPLPNYSGEVHLSNLQEKVEVFTDDYGAPHIFASSEKDLFYASGYIMAGERLFQLSSNAAAARGELALFYGDDLVGKDVYLRTWGIPDLSKKIVAALDPEILSYLEAFCQGINDRIDMVKNDAPLEFKLLRVSPLKWKPTDIAGLGLLMAHDLQQSWKVELVFGAIAEAFGLNKVRSLFPEDEDSFSHIPPSYPIKTLFEVMLDSENYLRELSGMNGTVMGSNNWVITGNRTVSGKPLLANDIHLGFTQPGKWIQLHLKGGSFNLSGVTLAGVPLPIIGQNENIAWGLTNIMVDDIDFFVETVDPQNPLLYFHDGAWKKMETRTEIIPLKSGADSTFIVRLTHHGPIISDIHPLLKNEEKAVSMAWTGQKNLQLFSSLFGLARARDWNDFNEALKSWDVPGQNFVFADRQGNIGWRAAAKIPIRKNGASLLPRPGENKDYDWQGYVPFEEMPVLFNPPEGFIATANQKTVEKSYPYYISNQFANPSRYLRIKEILESVKPIDVSDIKKMHMDVLHVYAREVTPYILNTKKGSETGNVKKVFEILGNWDWIENRESTAALIYHAIYNNLLRNVYGDELNRVGPGMLEAFVDQPMVSERSLRVLLRKNSSDWFDDITTPAVESRNDIIYKSILDAVMELENSLGMNADLWIWGKVHTLTHKHELGKLKILNKLFGLNVGPFSKGGSSGTISKGQYKNLSDYDITVGPSMRLIVDFSDLNQTQFVLPAGQSGIPASPHYDDQAELYNSGKYRTVYFDEDLIRASSRFKKLTLLPD